jgi:hypothetical protein
MLSARWRAPLRVWRRLGLPVASVMRRQAQWSMPCLEGLDVAIRPPFPYLTDIGGQGDHGRSIVSGNLIAIDCLPVYVSDRDGLTRPG